MLSADSRFKKLSLRKLADKAKKVKPAMRSRRSKPSAGAKTSTRFPWLMTPQAIVLGAICVLGGAALITARQPVPQPDSATIGAPPEASSPEVNPPTAHALTPSRPETKETVVPKTAARAAAVPMRAAVVPVLKPAPVPASKPATVPAPKPATVEALKTPAAEPSPKVSSVPTSAPPDVETAAAVTITGCLVRDEETFWLKDTSGADAPKSRSWKSGFLKKRSARIEVMDPTSSLRLRGYVGERISATGVLTNREMQARAVRRVGGSCD